MNSVSGSNKDPGGPLKNGATLEDIRNWKQKKNNYVFNFGFVMRKR